MDFAASVLYLTSQIPRGRITTYKEIAAHLGDMRLSRAVGGALHRNARPVEIPCHRVIRSNGELGGYSRGVAEKTRLLRSEGITVEENRVRDYEKILFQSSRMRKP